jgi:hypothetical protein
LKLKATTGGVVVQRGPTAFGLRTRGVAYGFRTRLV